MNLARFGHVIRKEFTRIRRDPATIRLLVVAPLLQLVLFGYAATNDVKDVQVVVFDGDRSPESRRLIETISHSHYFLPPLVVDDPRELPRLLQRGTAQLALSLPRQFARTMARGQRATVQLLVDGSDANSAGLAAMYLSGFIARQGLDWQVERLRREGVFGETAPAVVPEPRVWFNPELKSANYMVPGVFGAILLVITVNLSALSVVRERETGTLEQLMVTPLRNSEFLLGKIAPLGLIAFLESGLIVILARGWFRVPFEGSYVLLFGMAAVFVVCNLALGLVISVISRTQQEAQIVAFLLVMPSMLLSGFMFPIQNMPQPVQWLTYFIPFRYFLEIARALFLKGVGIATIWPPMLALACFTVLLTLTAVTALRRRL